MPEPIVGQTYRVRGGQRRVTILTTVPAASLPAGWRAEPTIVYRDQDGSAVWESYLSDFHQSYEEVI